MYQVYKIKVNDAFIFKSYSSCLSQARDDSIIDEKYTKNDFYEGQKGAAQVIHKHILTDDSGKSQIVCTDT
jgi:hypothetical protein